VTKLREVLPRQKYALAAFGPGYRYVAGIDNVHGDSRRVAHPHDHDSMRVDDHGIAVEADADADTGACAEDYVATVFHRAGDSRRNRNVLPRMESHRGIDYRKAPVVDRNERGVGRT
jgi:hypothetical protein